MWKTNEGGVLCFQSIVLGHVSWELILKAYDFELLYSPTHRGKRVLSVLLGLFLPYFYSLLLLSL